MKARKPQSIRDIRGQWENYALTHGLPMRCETNIVYSDGSCIVCSAANGEECQRAKPPATNKDWCVNMAQQEGDAEIGAGLLAADQPYRSRAPSDSRLSEAHTGRSRGHDR